MSFSDLERQGIEKSLSHFLLKRRPPIHLRSQVDIGCQLLGQSVELFELRPQWNDDTVVQRNPFAKATYVGARDIWKIYWQRADLRWHSYRPAPTVATLDEFLSIVDADEHACFFG